MMFAHYFVGIFNKECIKIERNVWYDQNQEDHLFYSNNNDYGLSRYMIDRFGRSAILSYCQCGYIWFLDKKRLLSVIDENPDYFSGFNRELLDEREMYYLAYDDES